MSYINCFSLIISIICCSKLNSVSIFIMHYITLNIIRWKSAKMDDNDNDNDNE